MLTQFENYFTFENIYLWVNFGVMPFWFMLIIIPNSRITQLFVNSIVIPIILAAAYVYVIYQGFLLDESIFNVLKLYLSLDSLYTIFASENFLLIFWIHFLTLNLFLGSWVSRDGIRYNIPRSIVAIPLILIYLTGPLGLVLYWLFRVFYAKRLGFHD
tara:strand:- start:525 stop:998 length:474 start_codon:yes stop_codon:yes gene_type:complete